MPFLSQNHCIQLVIGKTHGFHMKKTYVENICKFDNIDINIKQENNNSHKNSSFSKDIKQQLKQKYEELFFDKLKSTKENSKIHIYSKIKTEYEMNNYILNINYEDRKLLCKMRVSDHFFEI